MKLELTLYQVKILVDALDLVLNDDDSREQYSYEYVHDMQQLADKLNEQVEAQANER